MFDDLLALQTLPTSLDPSTALASQAVSQHLSTTEWLGPLAPVALSPFFGLALLSGIGTYAPDWLQQRSALFSSGSSFNNPPLFWSMLTLAVFTSLPRLTKVSKPLSLAADKLETYSAIIILFAVRMLSSQEPAIQSAANQHPEHFLLAAGLVALGSNLLMAGFAALNVLIINMIKLFCEFLVWLIPIPAIDALMEFGNKSLCAGLIGLYCYSPWLASLLNLVILAISLLVWLWIYRRINYYQHLITGPVLAWALPSWFAQRGNSFTAFIESSGTRFPKYLPVILTTQDDQYRVRGRLGLRQFELQLQECPTEHSNDSWVCQRLFLRDSLGVSYTLCCRKWATSDDLYRANTAAQVA
jgi:hypothetical protein